MANNRLYIVGPENASPFMLAKSMGTGWYVNVDPNDALACSEFVASLNDWFDGEDETGDVDLSAIREATDEEKQTLEKIRRSDFMKKLLAGEFSEENELQEECDVEVHGAYGDGSTELLLTTEQTDKEEKNGA